MIKNKKKQIGKGIVLATVLGLGWSVAGDISHAAGNELSQIQIDNWNEKKLYDKGDIVTYNGIQYEAQYGMCGIRPDESWDWKAMNGGIPKRDKKKTYFKGMLVTYERIQYEAKYRSIGGSTPDKKEAWVPVNGDIPEENEIKPDGEGDFEMVNKPDSEDDFEMVNKPGDKDNFETINKPDESAK
ncbi:hypothetical protein CN553_22480 [Bacillus cereus]|uniref:Chitin-binding type-3 domain-containing protein n=1 Tax=Bacillus cereus TaxID=1396 RepID=A0A9X6U8F1_BACCE|nr:hypothetical protein [Bacillus cereus]PEN89773.1 hypothetical protein CN553_22480 [Bacillus cereus]